MARRLEGSIALGASFGGIATGGGSTHMFLAPDADDASDANAGDDPAFPLATLDEVMRRLNRMVRVDTPVIVHIASPSVSYTWTVPLGPVQLGAAIVFIADGALQPGDDGFLELFTGTAQAGTDDTVLVTTGGHGVDTLAGAMIEITSGPGTGVRRSIFSNDATDLVPIRQMYLGVTPGDTYRVLVPQVEITLPPFTGNATDTLIERGGVIRGCGVGGTFVDTVGGTVSGVYFVNLVIAADPGSTLGIGRLSIASSVVTFVGGQLLGGFDTPGFGIQLSVDSASMLRMGCDSIGLGQPDLFMPFAVGLTPNPDARLWTAWTPFCTDNGRSFAQGIQRSEGYWFCEFNGQLSFTGGEHQIFGGRVEANSFNAALFLSASTLLRATGHPDVNLRFHNAGNDGESGTVLVRSGSRAHFADCEIRKTNLGMGILIWADGSGQDMLAGEVSVSNDVTFHAITDTTQPDFAVAVSGGGRLNFRPDPTVTGTWVGQIKVGSKPQQAAQADANGTFASLAADGDAYPQATALPAFLVHGVVQRQ